MENLSKLSAEDLRKLQKGIIEELSRRNNEAWNIAADNFKKAYDELMRIGFDAPRVMVGITDEAEEWSTVEYTEVINLTIDKTNKAITFEVEEVFV